MGAPISAAPQQASKIEPNQTMLKRFIGPMELTARTGLLVPIVFKGLMEFTRFAAWITLIWAIGTTTPMWPIGFKGPMRLI